MTTLVLDRPADVRAFEALAGAFLAAREAEHNLMLGLCSGIRAGTWRDPYFAVVSDGERVVAAALRTPPHNVILSMADDMDAVPLLVDDLARSTPDLPGVVGPQAPARRYTELWRDRTGRSAQLKMAERIYRLSAVRPARPTAGALRQAGLADRKIVVEWVRAFALEALGEDEGATDAAAIADHWLGTQGRRLYLWEDGVPVSMCGATGETPNGIRIGAVYTPPELRRRGYASACVAAVSQAQLDRGRQFCFLYTDLANPTSNKIYRAIGYEPVCDVDEYRFEARPAH